VVLSRMCITSLPLEGEEKLHLHGYIARSVPFRFALNHLNTSNIEESEARAALRCCRNCGNRRDDGEEPILHLAVDATERELFAPRKGVTGR
jgi:hypothetical protein